MKFRCPYCGHIFTTKVAVCVKCGKIMRYPGEPKPGEVVDKKASPTPYNVMNFFVSLVAFLFLIFAFFVPLYFTVSSGGEGNIQTGVSIFDIFVDFLANHSAEMAALNFQDFFVTGAFIIRVTLPLIEAVMLFIFLILHLITLITNFATMVGKKMPKELRGGKKNGQLPSTTTILIFAYLCALVPYLCGLWLLSTYNSGSMLVSFLHSIVDNNPIHGLSYIHILFIILYIAVLVLAIIRNCMKNKYLKDNHVPVL